MSSESATNEAVGAPRVERPVAGEGRFVSEARFYDKLPKGVVRCILCPRMCVVAEGKRGHCQVRENRGGAFYSLVYARVCAAHVDPIEKKPFFHFLPGSTAFSVATAGCNVNCTFCQNADISQSRPEELPAEYVSPQQIAALAKRFGCPSIAYTYGEPTVFAEFVMDTAAAAREIGVRNVVVSNGYIQPAALKTAYAGMDAVKVDLKAFTDRYYRDVVRARLKPVLDTLVTLRNMEIWTEIVYLVTPTLNDSESELTEMARWIKVNLGADVPLHFSRFHPDYKLQDLPATPVSTLERARAIAEGEGLHYVYIGNVPGHPAQNTHCPRCRQVVVERVGFAASRVLLKEGNCAACGEPIAGAWQLGAGRLAPSG
jgi:pyruvate formate lyase activating enzyme